MDAAGYAFVTGWTQSTNFPTANPLQPASGGDLDAFVTKLNAAGSALIYSTYLGGTYADFGTSIALDSAGNAYVRAILIPELPNGESLQPSRWAA